MAFWSSQTFDQKKGSRSFVGYLRDCLVRLSCVSRRYLRVGSPVGDAKHALLQRIFCSFFFVVGVKRLVWMSAFSSPLSSAGSFVSIMKAALILVSFCYASAFGLHSKTTGAVQKKVGFTKPAMVQPVDIHGERHASTTVRTFQMMPLLLIAYWVVFASRHYFYRSRGSCHRSVSLSFDKRYRSVVFVWCAMRALANPPLFRFWTGPKRGQ